MKQFLAISLVVLCFAAALFVTVSQYPRETFIPFTVYKPVAEQRTSEQIVQVEVDGRTIDVKVPSTNTVTNMVPETKLRIVYPPWNEYLVLVGRVLALLALSYYAFPLITLLIRDKWTKQKSTADTRDTRQRVDGMVRFFCGIVCGFLFAASPNQALNPQPHAANLTSPLSPIDPPPIPSTTPEAR
jgi:hypothetical protein